MASDINFSALNAYRSVKFADANAIINKDDTSIKQKGTYTGALSALTRSKATKAENNEARTQLLESLGRTFGLESSVNAEGKITFSEAFMDKLEALLGDAFKRSDFGLSSDGVVTSGKPLTQRRITAIMEKVDAEIFKMPETFTGSTYQSLFSVMVSDLKLPVAPEGVGLNLNDQTEGLEMFKTLQKILNKQVELENNATNPELANNPDIKAQLEQHGKLELLRVADDGSLQMNMVRGNYLKLSALELKMLLSQQFGVSTGVSQLNGSQQRLLNLGTEENRAIANEINQLVKDFAKVAVDKYFEAKEAGCVEQFREVFTQADGTLLARLEQLKQLNFHAE